MTTVVGHNTQPARAVGKAVHPQALARLLELWPNANVEVTHADSRYDGVDLKVTRVVIAKNAVSAASTPIALGGSRCRLDVDQWDRRHGIDLAFRRALREVKRMAEREKRSRPGRQIG